LIADIEGLLYLLQAGLPLAVQQAEHVGATRTRMLATVKRFKRSLDYLSEEAKLPKEGTPTSSWSEIL
jgi:hypothetical protein